MSRILVIDDEPVIRDLMLEILEVAGHDVVGAETGERGLLLLEDATIELVVSDIVMPGLSGLELLEVVRLRRPSLPVVLVSGAGTYTNLTAALARGANGFVMKPFTHDELQSTVAAALERVARTQHELEERVVASALAAALGNAIEARDLGMGGHCERIAELAVRIAVRLGLAHEPVETIRLGAILHDVGKIGIPDRVLLKPGPLTEEEWTLMRTHPLVGDALLDRLDALAGVRPIVRHHHERWDGTGYPGGLAREDIPLAARIVGLADAVEAMAAKRPYRGPLEPAQILAELRDGRARQWDPDVVDVALALVDSGELSFGTDGVTIADLPAEAAPTFRTVLLVEEDAADAALVTRALEEAVAGARVVHAADAASARQLCSTSIWSLAVVDEHLSGADALELVGELRRSDSRVPILVTVGRGSETSAVEAFRHGASDYVEKAGSYLEVLARRAQALLEPA